MLLISFTFLIAIVFIYALQYRLAAAQNDRIDEQMDQVANLIVNEIQIANGVQNGYSRVFFLPKSISGVEYQVNLLGSEELVIYYLNREKVVFLDDNVRGGIAVGRNLIEKINNTIYITILEHYNDTLPQNIAYVAALNKTAVIVIFNEKVESSAGSQTHYDIKEIGGGSLSVLGAELLPDNKTVILRIYPYHENNTVYNLTARNICDLKGNCMMNPDWKTYIYIEKPIYLIMTEYILYTVIYPGRENKVQGNVKLSNGINVPDVSVDVWINDHLDNDESGLASTWALDTDDFRFRCNISFEHSQTFSRTHVAALNASFLNNTCYHLIGSREESVRVFESNTVKIPSQVDDWNEYRNGRDSDSIIDANDEIVFFINITPKGKSNITIYYDDFYNETEIYASNISNEIVGKYFTVHTGNISFTYNLSENYTGIVNITSPNGTVINTTDNASRPGRLMDCFPNLSLDQSDANVYTVFEGPIRAIYFLNSTGDNNREEYIEVYNKKPYWKVTYTALPDTTKVEYHLLMVSDYRPAQYHDGNNWPSGQTYQTVTKYAWQNWSSNTGIGAIMAANDKDTPFVNASIYNYLRVNETNYSTIYSSTISNMTPGYFWIHVTNKGHMNTSDLSNRLRTPVTVTVKKEDFFLHTDPQGNYKYKFKAPSPPNYEGWYDLKVNTSKDNKIGVQTKRFYSANSPLIYLVSPANHTTQRQPVTLYCNATDYEDLFNISLYGNWTGNWEVNQTKSLHEFDSSPDKLFIAHFNGNAYTADGEAPVSQRDITYPQGKWKQGAFFGPSRYSNITYNSAGNLNPLEGTIEFWIRPQDSWDENADWGFFSSTNASRCDGFEFWRTAPTGGLPSRITFSYGASGYSCAQTKVLSFTSTYSYMKPGIWRHLAVTWNSTQMTLFVDGTSVKSISVNPPITDYLSQSTFEIGNIYPKLNTYAPNATFDEFVIYNRALNASEIKADYERTNPVKFVKKGFQVNLPSGEYAWNCKAYNTNNRYNWSQQGNYSFLAP